jgi:PAS domain S-box-containing protein
MRPYPSRESWESDLQVLWNDGERIICRGLRDTIDGRRKFVLAVLSAAERPRPDSIARLKFEYGLRDHLDSAWALRPIELVREAGRTILLLEDPGGEPLARLIGFLPLETGRFLRLAVALSTAVGQVHASGLIHKDIKPSNVFFNPATDQVWLTGFGIASRVPRERQSPAPPEIIAGTFAYMAPEQTGRMNRSIDVRSDLYSLGVTLYHALTGVLPFAASDPMEWIHCHIARQPPNLAERAREIPAQVCAIVMKLLAKAAEDRYQSAAGLTSDLHRCLTEWEASQFIRPFGLGTRDASNRLVFRETLYGREVETERLLAAFDGVVVHGASELVLVSGYSGIGKSSIVNELHRALVAPRGLYAAGKFDQYKRGIPYAPLAQASQSLVRPLLCKSDAELARWREALTEALGPHGQLMINLIPELALIIGEQHPVPDLSGPEAQNRFLLVFRQFLAVFARKEHPLVLFLDDMQWLDSATLDVFAHLATQTDMQHLLLVGAYRDNEVGPAHPLARRLEIIRQTGRPVLEIMLGGMEPKDVARMISDALDANTQEIEPLSASAFEKAEGNPFFTIQFASALSDEHLLTYDSSTSKWHWDIERINARSVSDNVVDLMIERLSRLPHSSLQALKQLACLGNTIEISKFIEISETSAQETQTLLSEPLRSGLLLQIDTNYAFSHDRVHEAAYAMLGETERVEMHRHIGSRLLATLNDTEVDAQIFEIVNQFNRGQISDADLVTRATVASLNLRAGLKAKAAAAYPAARGYLAQGRTQLGDNGWRTHYKLAFSLALEQAECTFVTGDFDETNRIVSTLLATVTNNVDRAAIYRLKVELHVVRSENERAIETGLAALRLFGIDFSSHPGWNEVQREFDNIWNNLNGCPIESFADLPAMTNAEMLAAMRLLAELFPPAYFTDFNLTSLVICRMVNLSLVHGAADASNQGLALLGSYLMGPCFGRYEEGHRIGELACELSSKRNVPVDMARVRCTMGLTSSWTEPLTRSIDWFRAAYRIGIGSGDLYFACYSSSLAAVELLLRGHDLREDGKECGEYLNFARRIGFRDGIDLIVTTERTIASLRGLTRALSDFSDEDFNEAAFEAELTGDRMNVVVFWYWTRKLMLHFLSGNYQDALAAADRVQPGPWTKIVQIQHLDYHYYTALALAAHIGQAPIEQRDGLRERLLAHRRQIRTWANETHSPTFPDKYALISAEIARIEGRDGDAERLYEESIHLAHQNGFLQNEAIANELAARFYAGRGLAKIARMYMRDARYCYHRWGADAKVHQLDEQHPYVWEQPLVSSSTSTAVATVERLDLATIVRVLQTISGEIVLDRLIDTLIRTAIEHAGAERAALLLTRGTEHHVEAEATTATDGVSVRLRNDIPSEIALPKSVIHYVARTREHVILDDAVAENTFSEDAYFRQHKTRSLLCLPLTNHAKLSGLLYLENNLAPRVFTPEQLAILKLLASQAAISLENTRLYADLEEREARIRRLVDSDVIGIVIWDLDGRLIDSNDAFLRMVQYQREDLSTGLRWFDMTPPEWQQEHVLREAEELRTTGMMQAREKEFFRKDGSRVPVLIGAAAFDGQPDQGVAYILDLTERKRAEAKAHESERRYREVQADLAHANRVATMGQLSASIAHEVNQPLTAMITNAQAALRWLAALPPNLEEVRQALAGIVKNGNRASDVIGGIRALVKKSSPRKDRFEINDAIREVIELTRSEAMKNSILVQMQFVKPLPLIEGDRVQLQQVILNVIVNAIEAMTAVDDGHRELLITTENDNAAGILVTIQDSGPGLTSETMARVFDTFYTTKPGGMGMGLSICRSIIEAHGGRVWTEPNNPRGAIFGFNLPVREPLS